MKKKDLRQQFMHQRLMLSEMAYEELNQALLWQFATLDLAAIKVIHLFLPIKERREPDTFLIRDWLKHHHPHIRVAYPKANFANHTMESYLDDDDLQLMINNYSIPEPVAGNSIEAHEIDLMIVPLLAFDKRGYRTGYGKGFYDRFMAQCRQETLFTGLSFFEPVDCIEDIEPHDRRLNRCITPTLIYNFSA